MSKEEGWLEHTSLVQELERKKRARSLIVPTDDTQVKLKLREKGQPICLFGEGAAERRDRLRYLLSVSSSEPSAVGQEKDVAMTDAVEENKEFGLMGTIQLYEMRKWLVDYSLTRAKERLQKEKSRNVGQVRNERNQMKKSLDNATMFASQFGGERAISYCSLSPNGTSLATSCWNGDCALWSVPDSNNLIQFKGHSDRVGGIVFHPQSGTAISPNSVNLASGGTDGTVLLWSLEQATPLAQMTGHTNRIARIAFHPSGRMIGTAGFDSSWRLWDVETQKEIVYQEGHSRSIYSISFQGDGSLCATGGLDSMARVWDLRVGRSIWLLQGHVKDVLATTFSPNGYQLATGSADDSIKIWDIRQLSSLISIPAHNSIVTHIAYKPHCFISSSFDGTVKIWDSYDFSCVKTLSGHEGKVLCVDSNDQWIVSAGFDRTFKLWSLEQDISMKE